MVSYPSFKDQCRIRREIAEDVVDIVEPHTKHLRWLQKVTGYFYEKYGEPTSCFLWGDSSSNSDPTIPVLDVAI